MLKNKFRTRFAGTLSMMLVIGLMAVDTHAATSKPSAATLTAERVADKNAAARGGVRAWLAVQSMTMVGKMDAGKVKPAAKPGAEVVPMPKGRRSAQDDKEEDKLIELPFVLEMQRPHKMRLEIEFAGQTAVQVFDGVQGWKLRPFLGRREVESYTPDEMKVAAQQQDMEGPLINYAAKGTKLTLDGMEQVEGKDAYKLGLKMKDGQTRYLWVDAKTFLDVKLDGVRKLNGKQRTVSSYFREYKTVDGLSIPVQIETKVEGIRDSEKINIERVTLNPKLDVARFAKPE